jgi:hypothetical protein
VPKHPDDYGYGSCTRCGWSEPEHIIDQLRDLMDASQARAAALEQELREMKAQGSLAAGANAQVCASS